MTDISYGPNGRTSGNYVPSGVTNPVLTSYDPLSIISGVLNAFTGMYSAYKNYQSVQDTNATNAENVAATNASNQAINQANLDYNWQVTQEQWRRDDTAYQRAVADAEKAGFSPLVAAGVSGGGVTSGLGAPSPIPQEAFRAQAPQIDVSTMVDSLLGIAKLQEEERHNKVVEGQRDIELTQTSEQLAQTNERLKNDARAQQILGEKQLAEITRMNDLTVQYSEQLAEQNRHNTESEQLRLLEAESQSFYRRVESIAGKMPYIIVNNESAYNMRLSQRSKAINEVLKRMEKEGVIIGSGKTDSYSGSGGVSGSVASGVNVGVNASGSQSHGEHSYENKSLYWQTELDKVYKAYPIPILINKHEFPEMKRRNMIKYN